MEYYSNDHHGEDYSKSSSEEETDHQSNHAMNDDAGMATGMGTGTGSGRSYECVFCKRGFTTAQALGGHMNIHRKDRAKSRPNYSVSSKVDDDLHHPSFRAYLPIHSYTVPADDPYPTPHDQVHINYHTFFPASHFVGPSTSYAHADHFCLQSPHHLYPLGGEKNLTSVSCQQTGPSLIVDAYNKESVEDGSEGNELDLELRLGHDHP